MRIANNIMAMNTHRQYTINNNNVAKSSEKLSSGYRINRAGDDAAGLAISEKMRAQIRGLNMASKNSNDAISLVQTAEGALQEVHSMLQRMNELAVQSATGTNETLDRNALSKEFSQLKDEIDQISEQTTFNNMNLLDGSLGASKMTVTGTFALPKSTTTPAVFATNATATMINGVSATKEGTYAIAVGTIDATTGAFTSGTSVTANSVFRVTFTATDGTSTISNLKASDVLKDSNTGTAVTALAVNKETTLDLTGVGLGSYKLTTAATGVTTAALATAINALAPGLEAAAGAGTGGSMKVQVGALEGETLDITIGKMDAAGLGLTASSIADQGDAGKAVTSTRTAINTVSDQRALLGAMQNRLEHKISNLNISAENLSAAESRIRDVDIAQEMTSFTKNNILSQAATAMLAQANAAPQNVLSLLR